MLSSNHIFLSPFTVFSPHGQHFVILTPPCILSPFHYSPDLLRPPIMRSYAFLATAAPLVLALPAPAPVAAPLPMPAPRPQGTVTNPVAGLLEGLIQGGLSLGSLSSAVPAVISDLGNLVDSADAVTRKLPRCSLPTTY